MNKLISELESQSGYRTPSVKTLQFIFKLSIIKDMPIMTDYWISSLEKKSIIGVKTNGKIGPDGKEVEEKLLVKSEEEYTSQISAMYKIEPEYVIMTENSIYIVDMDIPCKRISSKA
jgi:hypothetical protein